MAEVEGVVGPRGAAGRRAADEVREELGHVRVVLGARLAVERADVRGEGFGVVGGHGAPVREVRLVARDRERLGSTRVIQRRFNVSVPRARVPEKASTLRDRSER